MNQDDSHSTDQDTSESLESLETFNAWHDDSHLFNSTPKYTGTVYINNQFVLSDITGGTRHAYTTIQADNIVTTPHEQDTDNAVMIRHRNDPLETGTYIAIHICDWI